MKKIVLLFIIVFCMCCMVACGGEVKEDANTGGSNEVLGNSSDDEPVVTAEPTVEVTPAPADEPTTEPTPAPTEEPVEEATPAPTEEPTVEYEGIDMNSTLPGQEWLETFVGVIEEPKIVIFSDITGKKVILEQEGRTTINPDEDVMAIFFPEGYTDGNASSGIATSHDYQRIVDDNYLIFHLDSEKMRTVDETTAGIVVMHGDERIVLIATLEIE